MHDQKDRTAVGEDRGASGRRRPSASRLERVVAIGIAVLVNALAATLLLRAPALRPDAGATDAPIEVVWIERPRTAARPPAKDAGARGVARAAPSKPAANRHAALQAVELPADAAPPAAPSPLRLSLPTEPGVVPGAPDRYERRGVFGPRQADPFARVGDGPFRMQDRSLGGRLQRMTRRSDCAELRAQLRRGGDVEAVVRTMQERRCSG